MPGAPGALGFDVVIMAPVVDSAISRHERKRDNPSYHHLRKPCVWSHKRQPSETSTTTMRAISSGSPIRWSRIFSSNCCKLLWIAPDGAVNRCRIAPGATASTRTPGGLPAPGSSSASSGPPCWPCRRCIPTTRSSCTTGAQHDAALLSHHARERFAGAVEGSEQINLDHLSRFSAKEPGARVRRKNSTSREHSLPCEWRSIAALPLRHFVLPKERLSQAPRRVRHEANKGWWPLL